MQPFIVFKMLKLGLLFLVIYVGVSSKIQCRNDKLTRNLLSNSGKNHITLVIAHPDDEVMFFAPTLLQLQSMNATTEFSVVCYSNGNADGLGEQRAKELDDSLAMLLRDSKYELKLYDHIDGMNETWDQSLLLEQLESIISKNNTDKNFILTFDQYGVSNHVNHKACHDVAMTFYETHKNVTSLLLLNSYSRNFVKKYSSFHWELIKFISNVLGCLYESTYNNKYIPSAIIIWLKNKEPDHTYQGSITIFNPFQRYILALATMLNAHETQMVWFRYGWWAFSRFVFVNDLQILN